MVTYLDATRVRAAKRTDPPRFYSASGYGSRIPTQHLIQLQDKRWRAASMPFATATPGPLISALAANASLLTAKLKPLLNGLKLSNSLCACWPLTTGERKSG